jgi:ADP-ribose pyrophosphatase
VAVHKKRNVFSNKYLSIVSETFRVRGKRVQLFVEEKPDGAIVVPRLADGRFLLEKNYRHALGRSVYEFPAGLVEPGETPRDAALRELAEETGYRAKKATLLCEDYWSPENSRQRLFFFYADVEKSGRRHLDDMEVIGLAKVGGDDIRRMIRDGRICDGKTALAFLYFSEYFTQSRS